MRSWVLGDLLDYLSVADRYPAWRRAKPTSSSARTTPGQAGSKPARIRLEYSVDHPLALHPAALAYFRGEYERAGEAALTSTE